MAPGAYDAWSARLIEQAGFEACYLGGYGAAASMLAMPDLSLITASQMADSAARVADSPGYAGRPAGARRTGEGPRTRESRERGELVGVRRTPW